MALPQNLEENQRLQKAKRILGNSFKDFKDLNQKYNVSFDSPEWDMICFYFAEKFQDNTRKLMEWYKFWGKNRKSIRFENFNYTIPHSYLNFFSSNKSSKYFLELLEYYHQRKLKLSWDTFLQIFFDFRSKIMPKFNPKEFEVFQLILKEQTMNNTELKDKIEMDSSNLSKYKKKLRDKNILFEGLSINHSALNLAVYCLVYNIPLSSKIDFFEELPDSPFLHSIYTSYSNSQSVALNYVTPNNDQVKLDLYKLSESINEKNDIISSNLFQFDVNSRLKSFNFTNYDYKNGSWDLPYYKIASFLENKERKQGEEIVFISPEFEEVKEKILNLHKIGIEILNYLLMRNEMSVNTIKNALGISEKEARKQVENLYKNHYYKTRINPNYIFGLSNLVLFLEYEPSKQLSLHKQLSVFPELYSQKYVNKTKNGLHFIIRIPNDMIFDCMTLFNKFFKKHIKEMFVINQMYSSRWLLPTERYETVFQEWKYKSVDILGASSEF